MCFHIPMTYILEPSEMSRAGSILWGPQNCELNSLFFPLQSPSISFFVIATENWVLSSSSILEVLITGLPTVRFASERNARCREACLCPFMPWNVVAWWLLILAYSPLFCLSVISFFCVFLSLSFLLVLEEFCIIYLIIVISSPQLLLNLFLPLPPQLWSLS